MIIVFEVLQRRAGSVVGQPRSAQRQSAFCRRRSSSTFGPGYATWQRRILAMGISDYRASWFVTATASITSGRNNYVESVGCGYASKSARVEG